MSARDRILGRIRTSTARREAVDHPGDFEGWRPHPTGTPIEGLRTLLEAAGGELVRAETVEEATRWVREFCSTFDTVSVGRTVPDGWAPPNPTAPPHTASVGISMARGAVAETGSLVMDARDGRRAQLLVPVHVVYVDEASIFPTLRDAFLSLGEDLPSAIGLHSGPSKSADIGQIMVKGVHGPGRLVAVVVAEGAGTDG